MCEFDCDVVLFGLVGFCMGLAACCRLIFFTNSRSRWRTWPNLLSFLICCKGQWGFQLERLQMPVLLAELALENADRSCRQQG